MSCGCKVGRMATKSKSVTITTEDVLWGVGGAVVSLAANKVVNQATQSMPDNTRQMIARGLPLAKAGGGAYVATRKKTPRNWKFFALGVAGTGTLELGIKQAPQYFSIGGAGNADVFDLIGNTNTVEIPIEPSKSLNSGSGDGFVQEPILGTDQYAEELMIL